jgi:hypothetical protein
VNCTLSGNTVAQGDYDYAWGGGICNTGTLIVDTSVLSDNSASGGNARGGGIYTSGAMTATNCTLTGNSGGAYGGGILTDSGMSATTLYNTIVAANIALYGPDIYRSSGTLSGSFNIVGKGSGQSQLVNRVNGNQVGTSSVPINPRLDAAGRPLPGSPAINKGSNALAVDAAGNPLTVDRDGRQRIIYGTVDIGAYEFCVMADADYSGTVDGGDAAVLAAHWGEGEMHWGDGDFNSDGRVNAVDAAILAANWGATFTPPAEQSPAAPPARREPVISIGPMPAERTKDEGQRTKDEGQSSKEKSVPSVAPCASASSVVKQRPGDEATDAVIAEAYGPQVEHTFLGRQRLAWSHALARRTGGR